MEYNYDEIVRQWYEEIKPLFINYLRKSFTLDYDEIMDIYINVWLDVRDNILHGNVRSGTNWRAYILKMGWYQADKTATRRPRIPSLDNESFDRDRFEKEYQEQNEEEPSIYEDPELQSVLAAELSYIPEPCNKILKLYYHDELSMTEIADSMNYSSSRSAITTKNRCMQKLRNRMLNSVRRLGIIV